MMIGMAAKKFSDFGTLAGDGGPKLLNCVTVCHVGQGPPTERQIERPTAIRHNALD